MENKFQLIVVNHNLEVSIRGGKLYKNLGLLQSEIYLPLLVKLSGEKNFFISSTFNPYLTYSLMNRELAKNLLRVLIDFNHKYPSEFLIGVINPVVRDHILKMVIKMVKMKGGHIILLEPLRVIYRYFQYEFQALSIRKQNQIKLLFGSFILLFLSLLCYKHRNTLNYFVTRFLLSKETEKIIWPKLDGEQKVLSIEELDERIETLNNYKSKILESTNNFNDKIFIHARNLFFLGILIVMRI
jgi:hypothetical protein